MIKGNGKRARWSATKIVMTNRAAGSVEMMGSHVGLESGEHIQPDRRMKARDAEVVNKRSRIIENGTKSVKNFKVTKRKRMNGLVSSRAVQNRGIYIMPSRLFIVYRD